MREIEESYLAQRIEDYHEKSRSDLKMFASLIGKNDVRKYEKIDYEAFIAHFKEMIETLALIRVYDDNFDRNRFCNMRIHLENYVSGAREILIDLLMNEK